MIVVAILGIVGAIAIPTYMGIQKKGKRTEYKTNLEIIKLLEEKRHAEQGTYIAAADTAALMLALPNFQPGVPADLYYEYTVIVDLWQDRSSRRSLRARRTVLTSGRNTASIRTMRNSKTLRVLDGLVKGSGIGGQGSGHPRPRPQLAFVYPWPEPKTRTVDSVPNTTPALNIPKSPAPRTQPLRYGTRCLNRGRGGTAGSDP